MPDQTAPFGISLRRIALDVGLVCGVSCVGVVDRVSRAAMDVRVRRGQLLGQAVDAKPDSVGIHIVAREVTGITGCPGNGDVMYTVASDDARQMKMAGQDRDNGLRVLVDQTEQLIVLCGIADETETLLGLF